MKKCKIGSFWVVAWLSVSLFLAACGKQTTPEQSAAQSASQAIAASAAAPTATGRSHIVIGVDAQSAPLVFWDHKTGAFSGYDIELAKEVFKRAELKYEFRPIVWSEKETDLIRDKKIDVIWSGLSISPERKEIFAFSSPYIKNKLAILVLAESSINSLSDLKGKKVAVQKGSIGADLIKKIRKEDAPAKIEEFEQQTDQLSAVLHGQADAAVTDSIFIDYFAASNPGKFRVLSDSLQEEEFGVAVRPEDTELLEKINKALDDMRADGTQQAIHKRWFN